MAMAKDSTLTNGKLRGVIGPLAKIPFPSSAVSGFTAGSGTVIFSTQALNPDGSASQAQLSVPTGAQQVAGLRTMIYGRVVGVRWRRDVNAAPFDVVIDGVAYPVDNTIPRRDNQSLTVTDYEALHIVAADLEDRYHTVEFILAGDPAAVASRSVVLLGAVGERARGYNEPITATRGAVMAAAVTLGTTASTISYTTPVWALKFHNNDSAAPHTVTVYGFDGTTVYQVVTLPAGTSGEVRFAAPRTLSGWKWKADAATFVTGWVENS